MSITVEVTQAHIDAGERGDCCSCPVALALSQKTGQPVIVGGNSWRLHYDDPRRTLPRNAQDFIREFDNSRPVFPFTLTLDDASEVNPDA